MKPFLPGTKSNVQKSWINALNSKGYLHLMQSIVAVVWSLFEQRWTVRTNGKLEATATTPVTCKMLFHPNHPLTVTPALK